MSNTNKKSGKKDAPANRWEGRRGKFDRVGASIPKLTDPLFKKRGFATGEIIRRWADIVGPEIAASAAPVKLAYGRGASLGGVLTIRAQGGAALLIEHSSPQIIARINQFYGYKAVGKIKLVQARLGGRGFAPKPPRNPATLPPDAESALQSRLQDIENQGLKDALARLGREILVDKSD